MIKEIQLNFATPDVPPLLGRNPSKWVSVVSVDSDRDGRIGQELYHLFSAEVIPDERPLLAFSVKKPMVGKPVSRASAKLVSEPRRLRSAGHAAIVPWGRTAGYLIRQAVRIVSARGYQSFRDDLVGPSHKVHECGGRCEAFLLPDQVRLQDPTGPRTSRSNMDWNAQLRRPWQDFTQRRPTHRHHRVGDTASHERHALTE